MAGSSAKPSIGVAELRDQAAFRAQIYGLSMRPGVAVKRSPRSGETVTEANPTTPIIARMTASATTVIWSPPRSCAFDNCRIREYQPRCMRLSIAGRRDSHLPVRAPYEPRHSARVRTWADRRRTVLSGLGRVRGARAAWSVKRSRPHKEGS